jgi:hypothetical protein
MIEVTNLHTDVKKIIEKTKKLSSEQPSREMSIILTKLEEAELWILKNFCITIEKSFNTHCKMEKDVNEQQ